MTPFQVAREIGEHIFRWGLSCEGCTPEDFKIEMKKAVNQLDKAITQAISQERESCAQIVEPTVAEIKLHSEEMTAQEVRSVLAVLKWKATAIRKRGEVG